MSSRWQRPSPTIWIALGPSAAARSPARDTGLFLDHSSSHSAQAGIVSPAPRRQSRTPHGRIELDPQAKVAFR